MSNYVVFDNEGRSPDRYTIVDRTSGDVYAAEPDGKNEAVTGWYCGNCADHKVTLFGSGWRQMGVSRKVIEAETDHYVRNAQLNPAWLGAELHRQRWPAELTSYIEGLDKADRHQLRPKLGVRYMTPARDHEQKSPPRSAGRM